MDETWTAGFDSNEKIVEHLIIYMSFVERDAQSNSRNRKED